MKISLQEVDRCLREQTMLERRLPGPDDKWNGLKMETSRPSAGDAEVNEVVELVHEMPDIRADVVAALQARIEAGDYEVNEEEVADLMLRRALADRIR